MPSTYLDLTNRLLRRLNEVEISQSDFQSAKGIQATAKDCILDTIREINNGRIDWPFNAVEHTQQTLTGVEEYAWPVQFTSADWNSFQIQKNDALGVDYKSLNIITREEWYKLYRDSDYNSGTAGRGIPEDVFPSHGQGWGVTPSPDKTYTIRYRYYKNPTDMVNYDDQTTIPSKFDYVIMAGALYYLNLFKENLQGTQIMQTKFQDGIKDMVNAFLPNPIYMYGGVVNNGGDHWGGGFYFYKGRGV